MPRAFYVVQINVALFIAAFGEWWAERAAFSLKRRVENFPGEASE